MSKGNMGLLYPRGIVGWHSKDIIRKRGKFVAFGTCEYDSFEFLDLRCLNGLYDIGRSAACAYRDNSVTCLRDRLQLALKDIIIVVVIRYGGQDSSIGIKGDRRERGALHLESVNELRCNMGRITGAAAIAKEQQLVSFAESIGKEHRHLDNCLDVLVKELLLNGYTLFKYIYYLLLHYQWTSVTITISFDGWLSNIPTDVTL